MAIEYNNIVEGVPGGPAMNPSVVDSANAILELGGLALVGAGIAWGTHMILTGRNYFSGKR
jgi:hypothetical protein